MEDELLTKEQLIYWWELRKSVYSDYSKLNYDKNRKHNIIKLLEFSRDNNTGFGYGIAVNKEHQLHTKYDKDIQSLLRSNKIRLIRGARSRGVVKGRGWKKTASMQTYIVLND